MKQKKKQYIDRSLEGGMKKGFLTILKTLLPLLSQARGDTIRLVPSCDAVCRKNSPLAAYYVSNPMTTMNQVNMPPIIKSNVMRGINPPPRNVIPVVQRPQVPIAVNVVRPVLPLPVQVKPRIVPKPIIQKQIVEKPTETPKAPSPIVKVIPPTQVVRVAPMQPKPSPVINVQPRYLAPVPVPVQRYSYMNTPSYSPPQNMGFVPQRYIPQPFMYPVKPFVNPFGNFRLINKIGKKVNLIYHMLAGLKRRYFQPRPPVPGTVLVTPMVPRVTPGKPLQPVRMVRRMKPPTPISPEQKISTVTKYVTQPPPPPPQIQRVPVPPKPVVTTPKKVNICIVDEDCIKKIPGKPSKHGNSKKSTNPENESSSSDSSSDDEPACEDPKPEKPPYLLKSNKPNQEKKTPDYDKDNEFTKCYLMAGSANCSKKDAINSHGDFLPKKPDIGNTLTHNNDAFDKDDQVLYLSDLLRGW